MWCVAQQYEAWSGTGFALFNGYIVTNNHVAKGAKTILIRGVNGDTQKKYAARVVCTDKEHDLAILEIVDNSFYGFNNIPYSVRLEEAEVGEDVLVLGFPMTDEMGDEIKLTTGVLSARSGYQGDASLYQMSAAVQPGNSGGPLFDADGNVIGVTCSKLLTAENVGYAIKTSYLKRLLEQSGISSSVLPRQNSISHLSRPEKVKRLKQNVFFITCYNIAISGYADAQSRPNPYSSTPSQPSTYQPAPSQPSQPSASSNTNGRGYIRDCIKNWGECKTVAITKSNGDLALYGGNGYAYRGIPSQMESALQQLHDRADKVSLTDVHLTEDGRWLILYGSNGFYRSGLPQSLDNKLSTWNEAGEKILAAAFNDSGDWIAISDEHFSASEDWILDWLNEGMQKYNSLLSVCVTDDAMIAVYENGYRMYGNVPEDLKAALRETEWNVYHVKVAGTAWFISDKSGSRYRYKM